MTLVLLHLIKFLLFHSFLKSVFKLNELDSKKHKGMEQIFLFV